MSMSTFGISFYSKSQMLVVCICYCYNFHIFLSFASERVEYPEIQGCPMDWQDLLMVLGGAVMIFEGLLSVSCEAK